MQDGRKDLLAAHSHGQPGAHDGRLDEIPGAVVEAAPAKHDLTALPLDLIEPLAEAMQRALRDQRAHERALVERIADGHARIRTHEALDERRGDAALEDQSSRAGAALARG